MSTSRFIAWTIWLLASIFYAYQYILRVMPNIMLDDIMQQFQIDTAAFGQFSGIYYIGYSLMHLPIGIMLDRFGPKKVMSSCILLTVLGLLPIIFADSFVYPLMGRFLIGMGSSAAILGLFKIIRIAFSEARFARMLSFSVTIGLIGAIYGGAPLSYMCEALGYKMVVGMFAGLGVILAALTYIIVPEINNITTNERSIIFDIKEAITNKKVILSCIFAGFMVGPLEGFADVWGSAFLKQVYGFDNVIAASLPSTIFIGMCFGAPILSFIAEKTSYVGTIIGAGITMIIGFIGLILGYLNSSSISVSFIIIGICSAYQILAIYKASTYVSEHIAGITTAIANMIIMSFGYAFHSIIGLLIKINGGTESSQAFVYGISIIPVTLIIGSIGFMIMLYSDRTKLTT
jgi:predicted MFS family arabinose efflux permease